MTWMATMPARRFHLVCVGLPRSGVVSLFTLFGRFRASNEYAEVETIRTLVDHHRGRIDHEALRAYMARRDRESALEMDAASFLHLAGEWLTTLSDETRFVPADTRDPMPGWRATWVSWCACTIASALAARLRLPGSGTYGEMLLGRYDWEEIATPEARQASLPDLARRFPGPLGAGHRKDARYPAARTDPCPAHRGPRSDASSSCRLCRSASGFPDQREPTVNASPPGSGAVDGLPEGWMARAAAEICGSTHARALKRCVG